MAVATTCHCNLYLSFTLEPLFEHGLYLCCC